MGGKSRSHIRHPNLFATVRSTRFYSMWVKTLEPYDLKFEVSNRVPAAIFSGT